MTQVIDTLGKAARHGMFVRAACPCGNVRHFRAIDLAMQLGGGRDPRSIPFRCSACRPRPVKVTVLELDAEDRRTVEVWEPHEMRGRTVWMPRRME